LVDSITGASDGLLVIDGTTSWVLVELISSERIGVVIFLVVVAFSVVVAVVVADFVAAVVGDATFEVVTTDCTVVVVLCGGIPVGPTPILNPFVTQSSNSCFLSYSLKYVKPVQVKVINSDKHGQMNNKRRGLYGLHELSGLFRFLFGTD